MTTNTVTGRSVVVTGTARGIGRAIARRFLDEGYRVAGVDLTEQSDAFVKEHTDRYVPVAGDAGDPDVIDRAIVAAAGRGALDAFVACAGVAGAQATENVALEDWERIIRINLTGTFLGLRQAGSAMVPGGSVVAITSICGREGFAGRAAYCATKSGVEGLVRALAVEWAPRGIRVNAVAPGTVSTEMQQAMLASGHASPEGYLNRIPMGRFGEPSEIADAVAYLASGQASYITGVTLPVDGGWAIGGLGLDG